MSYNIIHTQTHTDFIEIEIKMSLDIKYNGVTWVFLAWINKF